MLTTDIIFLINQKTTYLKHKSSVSYLFNELIWIFETCFIIKAIGYLK